MTTQLRHVSTRAQSRYMLATPRWCPPRSQPTPLPRLNHLLAALSAAEYQRCLSQLEYLEMPLGKVLHDCGSTQSHVYFPTTSIVSLLSVLENGTWAESALIGNEGLVGSSLFMGDGAMSSTAIVLCAGHGFRLRAQVMKDEFDRGGPLPRLFLRQTQALMTQIVQTAACNRHHTIDQQLCRWLLLCLDRSVDQELVMTQELIANTLGVRREGVAVAALKLQSAGMIQYARGRIRVLDRSRLEHRACECYQVVKAEYDRLLPDQLAT